MSPKLAGLQTVVYKGGRGSAQHTQQDHTKCSQNVHTTQPFHLQGRNRDADVENGLVDVGRGGGGEMNWKSSIDIHTLPCVKQRASGKLL